MLLWSNTIVIEVTQYRIILKENLEAFGQRIFKS